MKSKTRTEDGLVHVVADSIMRSGRLTTQCGVWVEEDVPDDTAPTCFECIEMVRMFELLQEHFRHALKSRLGLPMTETSREETAEAIRRVLKNAKEQGG